MKCAESTQPAHRIPIGRGDADSTGRASHNGATIIYNYNAFDPWQTNKTYHRG